MSRHPRVFEPRTLREWFAQSGLTQAEAARLLGIAPSLMSRLLSGQRTPSYALAKKVAQITRVPMEGIAP